MRIYEIETSHHGGEGTVWQRFNVVASSVADALKKSDAKLLTSGERVRAVRLLAEA